MRIQLLLISVFSLVAAGLFAQKPTNGYWTEIPNESIQVADGGVREFEPDAYFSYQLDFEAIRQQLTNAPADFTGKPLAVKCPAFGISRERQEFPEGWNTGQFLLDGFLEMMARDRLVIGQRPHSEFRHFTSAA